MPHLELNLSLGDVLVALHLLRLSARYARRIEASRVRRWGVK